MLDRKTCINELVSTYSIRLDHKNDFQFFWPSDIGTLNQLFRLHKEVYEQFPQFDTDRDEFITMEEYNHRTYDFIHGKIAFVN